MRVLVGPLLALCLAAAMPGMAQTRDRVHATYQVYALGMHVADVGAGMALGPTSYRLALTYRTTGMLGFFSQGHQSSSAEGIWTANLPLPRYYRSTGVWHGEDRVTLIDYDAGRPVVRRLQPPPEDEHEPVPAAIQAVSIDTLSAVAELLRRIAHTSRCDAQGIVYDGRRASRITARTVGDEILPATDRSSFAGRALRCDFSGRVVAGFRLGSSRDARQRPLTGSAWIARAVPDGPPMPVMLRFETKWFGPAWMYLTGSGADVPVLAAADPAPVSPPAAAAPQSRPSR